MYVECLRAATIGCCSLVLSRVQYVQCSVVADAGAQKPDQLQRNPCCMYYLYKDREMTPLSLQRVATA